MGMPTRERRAPAAGSGLMSPDSHIGKTRGKKWETRYQKPPPPDPEALAKELLRLDDILEHGPRKHGFTARDIATLERRLNVLANIHGAEASLMWENCSELAVICNSIAMGEARGQGLAHDLLSRALALTVKTDLNKQDPERWKLRSQMTIIMIMQQPF